MTQTNTYHGVKNIRMMNELERTVYRGMNGEEGEVSGVARIMEGVDHESC